MSESTRVIVLLKSGNFYVSDEVPSAIEKTVLLRQVTGGYVVIPGSNVDAIEAYDEHELVSFRARLAELEQRRLAPTDKEWLKSEKR
jgi:hypothetical protein